MSLRIDGHHYELWIRREVWFLYRGEFNGTSFRHFLILKADVVPRLGLLNGSFRPEAQVRKLRTYMRQLRSPGWTLSTCADAVLHGIQPGGRYARRLPAGISRISRLRTDA